MSERLVVDEPVRLLEFLRRSLPGWKRSTLEQRIRGGCVRVNGATLRRNDVLAQGDEVQVGDRDDAEVETSAPAGIAILHVDDDLVAIDKPAGLLSVSTDRQNERTALALLRDHLSRPGRPARLWPVHRIDRETSGVLLFARSSEARDSVQAAWDEATKTYLALVDGRPRPPDGVIDQPLWEDRGLFVRVGHHPDAKEARTRYTTLEFRGERALLEVELETGRRHQIRAHLASLGHPIVGDPRYGKAGGRMELHALRLVVPHPADGRELILEAPAPKSLRAR
ncbi:MAG: RluA family pseudouridine synthase [Planctomycetes bacterium]|nr:RluA family pseudouridine synthase [Planctomycetota bacterium]